MKTFHNQRGPFREQPFFTDQELESICLDELSKYNLLPKVPGRIRIDRFVEKRFRLSVESIALPDGILGLTKFGPNGVEGIYVSEALESERTKSAERRVQSTIAHEAGHGLLHAHLFAIPNVAPLFGDLSDPSRPKVLCRESSVTTGNSRYNGEWWEFQANEAMGHLLMPRTLVHTAIQPFLISAGNLGGAQIDTKLYETAIRALAETFDVNPVVARIRIEKYYPGKEDKQLML